jgi:hypothetical protein
MIKNSLSVLLLEILIDLSTNYRRNKARKTAQGVVTNQSKPSGDVLIDCICHEHCLFNPVKWPIYTTANPFPDNVEDSFQLYPKSVK